MKAPKGKNTIFITFDAPKPGKHLAFSLPKGVQILRLTSIFVRAAATFLPI